MVWLFRRTSGGLPSRVSTSALRPHHLLRCYETIFDIRATAALQDRVTTTGTHDACARSRRRLRPAWEPPAVTSETRRAASACLPVEEEQHEARGNEDERHVEPAARRFDTLAGTSQ